MRLSPDESQGQWLISRGAEKSHLERKFTRSRDRLVNVTSCGEETEMHGSSGRGPTAGIDPWFTKLVTNASNRGYKTPREAASPGRLLSTKLHWNGQMDAGERVPMPAGDSRRPDVHEEFYAPRSGALGLRVSATLGHVRPWSVYRRRRATGTGRTGQSDLHTAVMRQGVGFSIVSVFRAVKRSFPKDNCILQARRRAHRRSRSVATKRSRLLESVPPSVPPPSGDSTPQQRKKPAGTGFFWSRRPDSNRRPAIYESARGERTAAFFAGVLLGPFGLIIACVIKPKPILISSRDAPNANATMKRQCPHCLSVIPYKANVCRNCQRDSAPTGETVLAPGVPFDCSVKGQHRWVTSRKRPGVLGCEYCLAYISGDALG